MNSEEEIIYEENTIYEEIDVENWIFRKLCTKRNKYKNIINLYDKLKLQFYKIRQNKHEIIK